MWYPILEAFVVMSAFLGSYGAGLWWIWYRFVKKPVDMPAKSATMPVLERDTQMSEQSVYDKLMHKVDREFALLSTEARDNIKRMIHAAMSDGYDRGVQSARPASKPANPTYS